VVTSNNDTQCINRQSCLKTYFSCINDAAANAASTSGATCDTWGASITNLRNSFAAGTNSNWRDQGIFKSCQYQACKLLNNANCSDGSPSICTRPEGAPTATNAPPLSSIPTAAPNQQTVNVTLITSFNGDYSSLFVPGKEAERDQFCATAAQAIATKVGLPDGAYEAVCSEGSLLVNIVVPVVATNTAVQDAILNNAANLAEDTDTTWIADLQTAAATICTTCNIVVVAPIISTAVIVEPTPEPAPNTNVEQTCGSGCIAGVIVGVAVLVIVVISVVKIVVKKISKGTEKTPASHEPTSGV
jgi:hypothetical protein